MEMSAEQIILDPVFTLPSIACLASGERRTSGSASPSHQSTFYHRNVAAVIFNGRAIACLINPTTPSNPDTHRSHGETAKELSGFRDVSP